MYQVHHDVRNYQKYCDFFILLQNFFSYSTHISCSSSTMVDHILASQPDRVSKKGIIDIRISDHPLIFCTMKSLTTKTSSYNRTSLFSLKNKSVTAYEHALKKAKFPNYENVIQMKPTQTFSYTPLSLTKQQPVKLKDSKWLFQTG